MKRGIVLLVLLIAIVGILAQSSREFFTNPEVLEPTSGDAALISKIKALGPANVNVAEQISYLRDFQKDVQKPSPTEPTEQMVDGQLNGRETSINPNDKAPLKEIIMQWFKIKRSAVGAQRESQQVAFTPSASMLGSDTTEPNRGGPSPTDVGNTVITQLTQTMPLGRGGEGAAQGMDAYNQDTPLTKNVAQKSSTGLNTGQDMTVQSALAEVPVKTQEIQGPRIPKMGAPAKPTLSATKKDDSNKQPNLFGPDAAPRGDGIGNLTGNNALQGPRLPTQSTVPRVTLPSMNTEVEPIPVLADFSKFFS